MEIHWSVYEVILESAKVTAIVYAVNMEKMEKATKMWMREVMNHKKKCSGKHVVGLKAKEIYGLITQGQENVKRFWLLLPGLPVSRDNMV